MIGSVHSGWSVFIATTVVATCTGTTSDSDDGGGDNDGDTDDDDNGYCNWSLSVLIDNATITFINDITFITDINIYHYVPGSLTSLRYTTAKESVWLVYRYINR